MHANVDLSYVMYSSLRKQFLLKAGISFRRRQGMSDLSAFKSAFKFQIIILQLTYLAISVFSYTRLVKFCVLYCVLSVIVKVERVCSRKHPII